MCDGTHSKAGNASTIDHLCDSCRSSVADSGKESGIGQSHSSTSDPLSGVVDTSPDAIQFVRLRVAESGLLNTGSLGFTAFNDVFTPGTEVSIMVQCSCEKGGTAVITTDPLKRSLLKSAEELQFRQDELKEDFSSGILQIISAVT